MTATYISFRYRTPNGGEASWFCALHDAFAADSARGSSWQVLENLID